MGFYEDMMQSFDWGADNARREAERALMRKVVSILEEKYASRGLRFTTQFSGGMPTQAYGYIDDMRFYFRYRHDTAELRVGPYNRDLEHRIYEKEEAQREKHLLMDHESWQNGEISDDEMRLSLVLNRNHAEITGEDPQFYPTEVYKCSKIEKYTGFPYRGDLTPAQALEVFSTLVDTLEEVPEPERIPGYIKEWLSQPN